MNVKEELIKAYDESIIELYKSMDIETEDADDEDRAFLYSKREEMIGGIMEGIDESSKKDMDFITNNLGLYKQFFSALISEDANKLKLVVLEMKKELDKLK